MRCAFVLSALLLPALAHAQAVQTVRSSGPGAWGAVRLVEELRIGVLEGPDEYTFGRIDFVAAGLDGTVFAADGQANLVRMYDRNGRFVRNVGRAGEGPGEYRTIRGLEILQDGRLALWDPRNGRINLYRPDGEYEAMVRAASGFFGSDMFALDTLGNFYIKALTARPRPGEEWPLGFVRVGADGRVRDTVRLPLEGGRPSFVLATREGFLHPFRQQTLHAFSPHGFLVRADNSTYSFDIERSGRPTLRVQREHTPVAVAREERSQWEAWAAFFSRQPNSRTELDVPARKPALMALRAGEDGTIWVRRHIAAQKRDLPPRKPGDDRPLLTWRESPTWDVFEANGRFLGTVVLPIDTGIEDVRSRTIWAVTRGEMDENYVVRYRIETQR